MKYLKKTLSTFINEPGCEPSFYKVESFVSAFTKITAILKHFRSRYLFWTKITYYEELLTS